MANKEGLVVGDIEAFTEAGRQLRQRDPSVFRRLLALTCAFASLHEVDLESSEMFAARLELIAPRNAKPLD